MEIKKLNRTEYETILPLVWKVFLEYEAVYYTKTGQKAFYNAINDNKFLDMLDVYGAYYNDELVGVLATRNQNSHIALFFVDGKYHHQGIGRKLFEAMLQDSTASCITVHSSIYATNIYHHFGFVDTDVKQEENGIQYIPMELILNRKVI
jgi:predicted GNAT family N-acyltransferase